KLQEQDERAEQLKGRLRWEQRELRVRLEQLQGGLGGLGGTGVVSERMRNDKDVEVDVESMAFECLDSDGLGTVPHAGIDH
ncbi:unnamed protein product, partial [Coregonus sp. 'balchen']